LKNIFSPAIICLVNIQSKISPSVLQPKSVQQNEIRIHCLGRRNEHDLKISKNNLIGRCEHDILVPWDNSVATSKIRYERANGICTSDTLHRTSQKDDDGHSKIRMSALRSCIGSTSSRASCLLLLSRSRPRKTPFALTICSMNRARA